MKKRSFEIRREARVEAGKNLETGFEQDILHDEAAASCHASVTLARTVVPAPFRLPSHTLRRKEDAASRCADAGPAGVGAAGGCSGPGQILQTKGSYPQDPNPCEWRAGEPRQRASHAGGAWRGRVCRDARPRVCL